MRDVLVLPPHPCTIALTKSEMPAPRLPTRIKSRRTVGRALLLALAPELQEDVGGPLLFSRDPPACRFRGGSPSMVLRGGGVGEEEEKEKERGKREWVCVKGKPSA